MLFPLSPRSWQKTLMQMDPKYSLIWPAPLLYWKSWRSVGSRRLLSSKFPQIHFETKFEWKNFFISRYGLDYDKSNIFGLRDKSDACRNEYKKSNFSAIHRVTLGFKTFDFHAWLSWRFISKQNRFDCIIWTCCCVLGCMRFWCVLTA
jgi:hypothetical protein